MRYKCNSESGCGCMTKEGCNDCFKNKLNTFDYLSDLPKGFSVEDYVEVQFKNTRKSYYLNSLRLPLFKGDMVAVEASPGHDIGTVTLTGKLVELQMRKARFRNNGEPKRVYRLAKEYDLDKYREAKALEYETMIESRQIAADLGLDMKIGDVEYQGDGQKAIFYYIADARVDFRVLIKKLAEAFHIRIEMKQIGARQEAARIGGIGPCGRQLCCSGWLTNFVSVGTNAARMQDLSMNPQKLAGQCAKLKCCLNYEVDVYFEAQKGTPSKEIELETEAGVYRFFKNDILAKIAYYVPKSRKDMTEPIAISHDRVFSIIKMNKQGIRPFSLTLDEERSAAPVKSKDILGDNSLTRFDSKIRGNKRRRNNRNKDANQPNDREVALADSRRDEKGVDNSAPQQRRNNRQRPRSENNNEEGVRGGRNNRRQQQGKQRPNRRDDQVANNNIAPQTQQERAGNNNQQDRRPQRRNNNRRNSAPQNDNKDRRNNNNTRPRPQKGNDKPGVEA